MKNEDGEKAHYDGQRERDVLISQMKEVARGIGATLAPFCEVVLHDLTHPQNAILAIHNNLSMREIGAPATELGLARIADPAYPQVIANYANQLSDGRQVKSTSIGIKGSTGEYVAALCLNVDLTMIQNVRAVLDQFAMVDQQTPVNETLHSGGAEAIRAQIDAFAAKLATTPRSLNLDERRALVLELKESGCMDIRRAPEIIAAHLGVSRATVYADAK
jgi:predicted transcriptional regulator YheO